MDASALVRSRLRVLVVPRDAAQIAGLLRAVLVVCALASVAGFVVAALFRLSYPYPLQDIETASLEQVQRILRGEPLYVAPTLQHVPLIYGPVSYYLAAAAAAILGPSYLPLRLVSLLASLGTIGLVGYLLRRETGSVVVGVLGAGLLAETFPLSGFALDLGRVDAVFAFLLLASLAVAHLGRSWWALVVSGVLLALAGLTKLPEGAAPVAVAITLYLLATGRPKHAFTFVAAAAATMALALLVLRLQSGPWPLYYLWHLPQQHAVNDHGDLLGRFWFLDILPRFTLPLLLGPAFLVWRAAAGNRAPLLFYGLASASLIGVSWASRTNSGGSINVLLPADVTIALLFGLGLDVALRELGHGTRRARVMLTYVLGVCVVQFALIGYNPRLTVPYRSEEWAAERLSTTLASLPGDVFAPDLGGYLRGPDVAEQPHMAAVGELFGSYGGVMTDEGRQWQADLASALRTHRYAHVVVDDPCCELLKVLLQNGYVSSGPLFPPDDDYWLWSGGRSPTGLEVFVPQSQ